jgi:hypothetical protein
VPFRRPARRFAGADAFDFVTTLVAELPEPRGRPRFRRPLPVVGADLPPTDPTKSLGGGLKLRVLVNQRFELTEPIIDFTALGVEEVGHVCGTSRFL